MFEHLRSWAAALVVLVGIGSAGAAYAAGCCNVPSTHQIRVPGVVIGKPSVTPSKPSGCGDCKPPPSCGKDCGGGGGEGGGKGQFNGSFSFNAEVSASAVANANALARSRAEARANSSAFGLGGAINGSTFIGGGGGSSLWVGSSSDFISSLVVEEGPTMQLINVPYQATRSWFKMVVIQAVCIDDKLIPHPASQVTPGRDIAETYEGELFRCLAGARMQYTLADFSGKVDFSGGKSVTCDKNQALYHGAGGKLECRAQKRARDCNERSLLRRYGAGVKVLKMAYTETYTAYRTEYVQSAAQAVAMGMSLDGGVGGIVH